MLTRLHRAAVLADCFGLSADELVYFQTNGADFDGFNLNALTLPVWRRIAGYCAARGALPGAGLPCSTCLPGPATPTMPCCWWTSCAPSPGGPRPRPGLFSAKEHFDLNRPAAFRDERNLLKMQRAAGLADRVGVDVDRLFAWAVPGSEFWACHQVTQDIQMAVRARFDADDWEQAVKPLNDRLARCRSRP